MNSRLYRRLLVASACSAAFGTAAAQSPATGNEQATTGGLEEIVVTAQRREENIQDVPIAISAVTASVAEQFGVGDPQSVTQLVPGFTFQRQASGSTPFVRGVGSTSSFVGNEPSVAVFVDDTYIVSGNAAIFEFNNVELVEVLKGPQGTLFGRNATGGVVHVHTRNPTHEPTMDLSIGYGNYDTITGQFYGSIGLTDTIAANLAVFGVNQDKGWGDNVTRGGDVLTNESWGVRGKVLWEPTDATSVLVGAVFSNRKSDQGMAQQVSPGYRGFAGYDPDALGAGFYDGVTDRIDEFYDTDFYQFSAKVNHDFGPVSLVSITAYSKVDTFFAIDLDASPFNILNGDVTNYAHTFTQELQLLSPADSRIKWIVGSFFLKDNSFFGLDAFGLGIPGVPAGSHNIEQARQRTTSISGFAQASMEVLPRTNVTLGLRYTSDDREDAQGGARIVLPNGVTAISSGPFSSDKRFSSTTGRFSIDYKFTDDLMVYAAYNRGFKSGVYNLPGYLPTTTAPLPPVDPEELNAYSIGFKSELFDRRLRLNAEAYYYDYKNIQVQNNVPPPNAGTILTNGGAATIKGVDVELTFMPIDNLTITATMAYADGEYDDFDEGPTFFPLGANPPREIPSGCPFTTYPTATNPAIPSAQRSCDLAGNETVNTPPFSAALGVMYTLPTSMGSWDFAVAYSHGGDYYSEPDNFRYVKQPKYDLVNASVKWTAPNDRYDIRLWGNNLTDEKYFSYLANSATSGPKVSPAAPRTYGVTFGVHF